MFATHGASMISWALADLQNQNLEGWAWYHAFQLPAHELCLEGTKLRNFTTSLTHTLKNVVHSQKQVFLTSEGT